MRLEFLVLALSITIAPATTLLDVKASGAGPWVMVVPPWRSADLVAERAGARLIGPTEAPLGHLVTATAPEAAQRLAAAGAWAVLDAAAVAQFCGEY
ncbi:hypothetical protein ACTTAL_02510 [Rhodobacter capsulatus]|uniref:hypothetical protein n=1 Tax=Rhodobacter capsulatus TaxID=1061 RepID=UPI0003D3868D|nr:hypothetical protein [Rhodobacter capsulatus]ETD83283.1 hypothetical protein U716_08550 [Rhodobacter capsulatus B6]ETD88383.1 hypothetical protein U713_13620 [Rhodobacter capsulatus YW2]